MSKKRLAPKSSKFASDTFSKLSLAYVVVSLLALFLPLTAVSGEGFTTASFSIFTATAGGMVGLVSTIMRFAFAFLMLATATLAIIAIVKPDPKQTYLSIASLLFLIGCGGYTISVMTCSMTLMSSDVNFTVDVLTLILAIAGCVGYCFLLINKNGEIFMQNILQLSLTVGYFILVSLAIGTVLNEQGFIGIFALLCMVLATASIVFELLNMDKEANLAFDRIRFFVTVGVATVLFLMTLLASSSTTKASGLLFALLAIAFALGQLELINGKIRKITNKERFRRPRSAFDTEEETSEAAPFGRPAPMPSPIAAAVNPATDFSGFRLEEYAEAIPYEGGPIEGVEMAEEVNPTFTRVPHSENQVNTAGYDFYNSKSFDPFIATLDMEERNQFTELFILKYKGVMPEIPDYVVGGDNKEFFRLVFLYLGQYRDRIPDSLLAKMYNFSVRL